MRVPKREEAVHPKQRNQQDSGAFLYSLLSWCWVGTKVMKKQTKSKLSGLGFRSWWGGIGNGGAMATS